MVELGEISYSSRDGFVGFAVAKMTIIAGIKQIDESRFRINYLVEDPDSTKVVMNIYEASDRESYNGIIIGGVTSTLIKGEGSYILNLESYALGEY